MISGAVAATATISALRDIKGILTAPLRDGFAPRDHAAATEAVTRITPLAYQTPAAVAALTADLAACGLPPDFPNLALDDIATLTTGHINGAYKSHFSAGRISLIAVGDAAILTGPLQELAGPVQLQVIHS